MKFALLPDGREPYLVLACLVLLIRPAASGRSVKKYGVHNGLRTHYSYILKTYFL